MRHFVFGLVALTAVGVGTGSKALAQAEALCRLPSNDTIKAAADVCTKLGGSPVAAEGAAAQALYGIWKANSRTEHAKAYAAAEGYLRNFPHGGHARELQAWAAAYEKVMKSGLATPPAPAPPHDAAVADADARQIELAFWQSIATSTDAADFKDYLQRYPEGAFASLAQRKVAALEKLDKPAAPPPPQVAVATPPAMPPRSATVPGMLFGARIEDVFPGTHYDYATMPIAGEYKKDEVRYLMAHIATYKPWQDLFAANDCMSPDSYVVFMFAKGVLFRTSVRFRVDQACSDYANAAAALDSMPHAPEVDFFERSDNGYRTFEFIKPGLANSDGDFRENRIR
jgi:hypothetical protein